MTDFLLNHEEIGGALIVRCKGRFDRGTGEAVETLVSGRSGPCVLNLEQVDYISSSGVAALVKLSAAGRLKIASPASCVSDVLSLAGVTRILSIHPDERGALDAC